MSPAPLQRDQFETLYRRISDASDGFKLDRLPPDADPYPTGLSLHPRFEVDEQVGTITETDDPTATQLVDSVHASSSSDETERTEPADLDLYGDALLLIDALERHAESELETVDTPALVNLYTLCSDVQRDADNLRQAVADALLDRIDHDQSTHGQYGSVKWTSRRRCTLKDEEEVLATLEAAGVDRERVLGVDREKVDDALGVTDLSESDVYEIDERTYVRKAEVDEAVKASRLQGLKDRLADLVEAGEAEAYPEHLYRSMDAEYRLAHLMRGVLVEHEDPALVRALDGMTVDEITRHPAGCSPAWRATHASPCACSPIAGCSGA